jgi:uncharacterized protein (TIGR03437 family)
LGTVAPADPLAVVNNPPTVTLGTAGMTVISATLVPVQIGVFPIGVYQIKAKAPPKVQPAPSTPLTVSAGGNSATYNVRVVSP